MVPLAGLLPTGEQAAKWLVQKGLALAIILILSVAAYEIATFFINKVVSIGAKEEAELTPKVLAGRKRAYTLGALLRNLVKYAVFFVATLMVVSELVSRNIATPLLASAGVAGLAIGFGAQSFIKDVVSGFFILFEGQYAVGDFVSIKAGPYDASGVVEEFGLRMTMLRDIDGNLHYVPNGSIMGVDKFTGGYVTYAIEAIIDADGAEKATEAVAKIAADVGVHQPFLLSPPTAEVAEGFSGESVVRLKLHVVPTTSWVADAVAARLAKTLAAVLDLEEEPATRTYTFDENTAGSYGESVLVE